MGYKRILTVQDISCVGQCSLTVALPILAACGMETAVLPSAVLSTHTGGFTGVHFRDLTEDIPAIEAHWRREGITFDAFYTGYLGSRQQIGYVSALMDSRGREGSLRIVDPAMGDNGRLYTGFDEAYAAEMKRLCLSADVILPNITEGCSLTGMPYWEDYRPDYIREMLHRLRQEGAKTVVLTGVHYAPGSSGVAVMEGDELSYYEHRRVAGHYYGTGDVYAATFTGALLRGLSTRSAAALAADYTLRCIENTVGDEGHWYGVKFEEALPWLLSRLEVESAAGR